METKKHKCECKTDKKGLWDGVLCEDCERVFIESEEEIKLTEVKK